MDQQRSMTLYGIDHYVVPTADTARWCEFYTNVLGSPPPRPGGERGNTRFTWVGQCHVGGSPFARALPAGTGFPRYGWFIQAEDVEDHLKRLDGNKVPHSDPQRTSEDGEEGTAIRFEDPDGNGLEFWAPSRMPEGAMDHATSAGVGCISAAVFESRDLERTRDFFSRYCGLESLDGADVAEDTLVLPLAGIGRLVFKKSDRLGTRSSGHAVYRALHTALVIHADDFMPAMERMWDELPEWDYDPEAPPALTTHEAEALPARTCIHGSPIGAEWKRVFQRGDSFSDPDTSLYHFVAGLPVDGSMLFFEPVGQETYLDQRKAASA